VPYPGFRAITVRQELYHRLQTRYRAKTARTRVKPSLSGYISQLLWEVLERDDLLHRYGPVMEFREVRGNRIRVLDNRTNELIEVQARDGSLSCAKDQREDCAHVGFCFATPEVFQALAPRNFGLFRRG
jgi:hypothetical protein